MAFIREHKIITFLFLLLICIQPVSSSNINGFVSYRDEYNVSHLITNAIITVYNDTWSNSDISEGGMYSIDGVSVGKTYYVSSIKSGYLSATVSVTPNINPYGYSIPMYKEDTPNYITPHYVKYTVQDIYGNKYKNIQTKLYYNGVLDDTIYTGTDGRVGFEISETKEYTITFINSTQGISRTWEGYPTESYYNIVVFPTDVIPDPRQQDDILFGLNGDRINVSSAYINVTFNDTSLTTNYANLKIYQGLLNDTVYYSSATTDTNKTWSVLVPANNTNYTVMFTLNNDQMNEDMVITRILTFHDENRYDLGFNNP